MVIIIILLSIFSSLYPHYLMNKEKVQIYLMKKFIKYLNDKLYYEKY